MCGIALPSGSTESSWRREPSSSPLPRLLFRRFAPSPPAGRVHERAFLTNTSPEHWGEYRKWSEARSASTKCTRVGEGQSRQIPTHGRISRCSLRCRDCPSPLANRLSLAFPARSRASSLLLSAASVSNGVCRASLWTSAPRQPLQQGLRGEDRSYSFTIRTRASVGATPGMPYSDERDGVIRVQAQLVAWQRARARRCGLRHDRASRPPLPVPSWRRALVCRLRGANQVFDHGEEVRHRAPHARLLPRNGPGAVERADKGILGKARGLP